MEPIETEFSYSFDAMFEGCDQLAINLEEELSAMGNFKAKYTAGFVADFKLKIKTARELPDVEQRSTKHELMRIELVQYTDTKVRKDMGALRLYIRDAYEDPEVRRVKLQDAGFNDYESAMNYNWEKLRAMLLKADVFIAANTVDLEGLGGMPAGFGALISGHRAIIDEQVPQFLNEKENTPQGTQEKVIASNIVYRMAILICEDGQHVFADNPAKQKQFVWDSIMEIVTPTGKAGLKFDVKANGTFVAVANAKVTVQRPGFEALETFTDSNGKGVFDLLQPGEYKGTVEAAGFATLQVEFTISPGVTSFKHWLLSV